MKTRKINIIRAGAGIFGIGILLITALPSFAAIITSVPFTSQAPSGSWAQPWQDFCEEASILFRVIHDWNGGDVTHGEKDVIVVGR